jgi:hypothetical protein
MLLGVHGSSPRDCKKYAPIDESLAVVRNVSNGVTATIRHKPTVMTILAFALISSHDRPIMTSDDQVHLETFLRRAIAHREQLTEEYGGIQHGSEHYASNRRAIGTAIRELDEIIGRAYVRLCGCRQTAPPTNLVDDGRESCQ